MQDYRFFQKGTNLIAIESENIDAAAQLIAQGFEKQFEEIGAADEKTALIRLLIFVKIMTSIAIISWQVRVKCRGSAC